MCVDLTLNTVDQMSGGRVVFGIGYVPFPPERRGLRWLLRRWSESGAGINAVPGARYAGATTVVAIDPNPFKLEMASKLGATHTATTVDEAQEIVFGRTHGQMADLAVITVGVLEPQTTVDAVGLIGKAGRVVVTSVSSADEKSISLTGSRARTSAASSSTRAESGRDDHVVGGELGG